MTKSRTGGAGVLRRVLSFALQRWQEHRFLAASVALGMTLATVNEIFVPVYAGRLVDAVARGPGSARDVLLAFAIMAALGVAMVILRHFAYWAIVPLTSKSMSAIARESFHRVQRFSTDWHNNSFAGSTVRKITRGMWALDSLNDVLLLALLPSLVVLVGTVLLFGAHWPVMGIVMAIGAVAYLAVSVVLSTSYIAPASSLSNAMDTRIGGALADSLGANAVVKAFGAELREDSRLARVLNKWQHRTARAWMRHIYSGTAQLALTWIMRTVVTATAIWLWHQGRATAGDIAFVLTAYFVLHGYLRDIGYHINQLQRAVNEMEEMVELYAEPYGVADKANAKPLAIVAGDVRFENVTFCYAGQTRALFRDLNVRIPAGQRVGLVGHSGSGKTTFVKLIQRLYDVTGGGIVIDAQNIAHATQASLRSQIAIVQQEPILFHRSLAENISYARPDATTAEIERAARLANAHDFIMRLPRAYQTLVGERGVKLSGGERQRVALARAFLADAPILILDEATSSLDSESEALIQQAMDRLMRGRTSIVIAHRLSTVRAMDRILVFAHGSVLEDGDHLSLLELEDGHYRRLFDRQSGAFAKLPELIE
jgi:ATP-binding cassette subfamily B protein